MSGLLHRAIPWAMIGLCLLLFIIQTLRLQGVTGSDFIVFHEAVQRGLADPARLYADIDGVIPTARSLQGYLYPPPATAMLLPFSLGSIAFGHALLSWAALLCAVAASLAWLAMAQRGGIVATGWSARAALVMMTLVTGAVFTCRLGQVDPLILAIITLGVWMAFQQQPRGGAAVLAAGSWIKIYPVLLMLPLMARPDTRWPALLGFVAGGTAILIVGLLVFPLAAWRDFATMLPIMAERTIINIDNQSLLAIWARTAVPAEQALTTYDTIIVPAGLRAAVGLFALATVAGFMWRARQVGAAPLWVAAAVTALISLIAPLGWGHSYAYVLPLLILCLAVAWQAQAWGTVVLGGVLWAALVVPAHRQFPVLPADSLIWHLAYARYALAAILLLALAWWQMGWRQMGPDARKPEHP